MVIKPQASGYPLHTAGSQQPLATNVFLRVGYCGSSPCRPSLKILTPMLPDIVSGDLATKRGWW